VDFGIAKATRLASANRTGSVKGKLPYMSPEQARGLELDGRADLYALGALLYELVSGAPPFPADGDLSIIVEVLNEEPPPVTRRRPDAPVALVRAIGRAMAKDREARPADARAWAAEIDEYLQANPAGAAEVAALMRELFGAARP